MDNSNSAVEVDNNENFTETARCRHCAANNNSATMKPEEPEPAAGQGNNGQKRLYYQIDENPPWYLTTFLGFQHYMTVAGASISVPFILTPKLCMVDDDPDKAKIISTIMFVSGIVTLLQSTFGSRLPIIQGGSFAFIVPALSILALPEWQCPAKDALEAMPSDERTELWQERIRVICGAIMLSSIFEVFFGALGIVGMILKYITPMTIAPAISLIGFSLFDVAAQHAATNWKIAALTIFLVILFSQYLKNYKVPVPFTHSQKRNGMKRYPAFEVFPMLLSMIISWVVCIILTYTDVLPPNDAARTDIKTRIIEQSPWFRVPYPFQWGPPIFVTGAVLGMLSGVIAGAIESIGDYYACARISGAPDPPVHAINRGIMIEGIGCILAAIWGTGNGSTSFSENIGAMSVTNVGSRRVIQTAGILMLIFGLISKIGAIFVSIPEPIVGGIFCIVFGIVTAVGLSNLQTINWNSSRNIFIVGFSLFFSLSLSKWMAEHPGVISVGVDSIDQILNVLGSTGMFLAGLFGFVLDNTIPGTPEERGLQLHASQNTLNVDKSTYDLPIGMNFIRSVKFFRHIPFSPTFQNYRDQYEPDQAEDNIQMQSPVDQVPKV